jgi:hypothetical protein
LFEYVGAVRLTPSGEVLDDPPVNICNSISYATVSYPAIATNGRELLCVMAADTGLYGCIVDYDLKIAVDRFLITGNISSLIRPRIAVNGNNFIVAFESRVMNSHNIKMATINPEGQILSIQQVNEKEWNRRDYWGGITISSSNATAHITYFQTPDMYLRNYSSDGQPIDTKPIIILESQDFGLVLKEYFYTKEIEQYIDLVSTNKDFCFFWPRVSHQGISMIHFRSNFLTGESDTLNSQCRFNPGH